MSVQIQHPGEPFYELPLETTRLTPNYRIDLRNARNLHPDRFLNANIVRDWSLLSWKEVGKPYQVENMSKTRTSWKKNRGSPCLPILPGSISTNLFMNGSRKMYRLKNRRRPNRFGSMCRDLT